MSDYKWVETSPGRYKLVKKDDPRPAVKLKEEIGPPRVKFSPSWKKHEEAMKHPDSSHDQQVEATDKFVAEREHEMNTNPKARRWEESRKKYFEREKPAWRQKMIREGVFK